MNEIGVTMRSSTPKRSKANDKENGDDRDVKKRIASTANPSHTKY